MTDDNTTRSDAADDIPVDTATRDLLRGLLQVNDGPSDAIRQAHMVAALAAADAGETTNAAGAGPPSAARRQGSGVWLRGLAAAAALVVVAGVGVRLIAGGSGGSSEDAATDVIAADAPATDSDARASSEAGISEKSMSSDTVGTGADAVGAVADLGSFDDPASLRRALDAASASTTTTPPDAAVTPPTPDPLSTDEAAEPAMGAAETRAGNSAGACELELSSRTGLRATAVLAGEPVIAIASSPPIAIRLRDCTVIDL